MIVYESEVKCPYTSIPQDREIYPCFAALHPISGGYAVVCRAVGRNLYPYTRYVPRRTDQIAIVRQKIGSFDFNGSNFSRIDTLVSLPCRQRRSRCRQGNGCFLVDRLYLIQRFVLCKPYQAFSSCLIWNKL